MKAIIDLCVVPIGVGVSVSTYIAACERVLREAGLKTQLHAYGTNIEGDWDVVFAAIKRCHEVVHEMGAPRISTTAGPALKGGPSVAPVSAMIPVFACTTGSKAGRLRFGPERPYPVPEA